MKLNTTQITNINSKIEKIKENLDSLTQGYEESEQSDLNTLQGELSTILESQLLEVRNEVIDWLKSTQKPVLDKIHILNTLQSFSISNLSDVIKLIKYIMSYLFSGPLSELTELSLDITDKLATLSTSITEAGNHTFDIPDMPSIALSIPEIAADDISDDLDETFPPSVPDTNVISATSPITYSTSTGVIGVSTASTSTSGVTTLSNSYVGTSTSVSVTEKALSDGLATKQPVGDYLTNNQSITISGDISGTGTTSISTTLPTVNTATTSTTYNNFKVDNKGRVTEASTASYAGTSTASTSSSGLMSSSDKTKLDALSGTNTGDETESSIKTKLGISTLSGSNTGDQDLSGYVPTSRTVNGHQLNANISVTASDVGLGNCNDTSDLNKPVSTAQQAALNSMFDSISNNAKIQLLQEFLAGQYCTASNIKGLWLFDPVSGTTVYDRSGNSRNFTLSANASTLSPSFAGLCPYLNFSSSAYFDTPDHDDFSFGDGSTDNTFSIILLINPTSFANNPWLFAKEDSTTGAAKREWSVFVFSNTMYVRLYDNSTGGYIGRQYNTSIAGDTGSWHTYICTYSGNSSASGVKIYRDGVQVDNTDYTSGSYTAMENTAANVGNYRIYTDGLLSYIASAKYGAVSVIKEELTATQVNNISDRLLAYAGSNLIN